MPEITDINTTKTRLHRLMQSATPKPASEGQPKQNRTIQVLLVACLIGTMIPIHTAMVFFSLASVVATLLLLTSILAQKQKINRYISTIIIALAATSIISGCSPAFTFQNSPELLEIAHENDYKIYTLKKIGIFGLGMDQATVETAKAESHIKQVRAIQIDKGHGLVSIITITIAGEA